MLYIIGLSGFIAVSMGAFGAHGLQSILSSQQLAWWETATMYLFIHTLASLAVYSLSGLKLDVKKAKKIQIRFMVGNLLFAGSLYIMALTQFKKLGMITPLGGLFYLVAWASLGLAARQSNQGSVQ